MDFQVQALDSSPFEPLYGLDDEALAARGVHVCIADARPGYPCRVSLEEAEPGSRMLLLNHTHVEADTPYHGRHAIFVRDGARTATPEVNEVPEVLARRMLSLRGFDRCGMMVNAALAQGAALADSIAELLAEAMVEDIHVHNAVRGCFAARIRRAGSASGDA